jgi:peptidoglycan/xylan/chitin deacetylase (PgdA/CDA1 family)
MATMQTDSKPFRRRHRSLLTLGLAVSILAIAFFKATYNGFTLPEWWHDLHSGVVVSRAVTSEKVVAVTFDDGPDPAYTPRVLAILNRYSIHATFFEEGRMIQRYPQLARSVVAQGNVIGNHTFTHPYLTRLSPATIHTEIESCDHVLASDVGISTTLFRSPRGDWNPAVYREVQKRHDHLILWTVALEHHDVPTPQAMAQRVLNQVQPGAIILMHDGGSSPRGTTVQALPLLIEGLQKRGYRCVTIPQLLHLPAPASTMMR